MDVGTNGNVRGAHEQRLMALLRELVHELGRADAAEALAVDPRTLATSLKRGRPSRLVRDALERRLGTEPQGQEGQEALAVLAQRVEAVEREAEGRRAGTAAGFKALRDGHVQDLGQLEQRLARLEARLDVREAVEAPGPDGEPEVGGPPSQGSAQGNEGEKAAPQPRPEPEPEPAANKWTPPRRYPDLVTEEPAPDDEQVYGKAWPLVDEWRRLWEAHHRPGKGLEWLRREERILELEVAMLEEHQLTLPPATYPRRGMWRNSQLTWRWKALRKAQRARAWGEVRRWLGRALVAGLLVAAVAFTMLIERASTGG